MDARWSELYALQDRVLGVLREVDQGFYLTGGTALSRGFYEHRFSEDLDFFVNDREEFALWLDRCIRALTDAASMAGHAVRVVRRDARFGRLTVGGAPDLKLEFVNDVPSRTGEPAMHPILGRLDTRENILANKITALVDRAAPKDLADIYWLCCRDNLDLNRALDDAAGKAAGIFPPLLAKRIEETAAPGVPAVMWITPPREDEFRAGIDALIRELLRF